MFIVFMISALAGWNTIKGHVVLGSTLSLLFTSSVIASYVMIVPWRKHPSVLIIYRSLTSMVFAVNIILDSISSSSQDGRAFAFVTEFMLLLGECWLTTIAVDLVHSLTNPFISYRYNLHRFSTYNVLFSLLISVVFYFNTSCQGDYDNIYWVQSNNGANSPCLWGYYFVWIACMYAYQLYATLFAYYRLRKGLSSSFDLRKQCANDTFKVLSVYAIYLSLIVIFLIIVSSNPNPDPNAPINNFALFILFLICNRGTVDAIAWFMLHDFDRGQAPAASDAEKAAIDLELEQKSIEETQRMIEAGLSGRKASDQSVEDDLSVGPSKERTRSRSFAAIERIREVSLDVTAEVSKGINQIAAVAIQEIDEADLSPQMNMALRQQVVQYVTLGVREAINQPAPLPLRRTLLQELEHFFFPTTDIAVPEGRPFTY